MKRHDDSQRSRPLAMMFGDVRVVDSGLASPYLSVWPRLR